jgi:hypothetical protein
MAYRRVEIHGETIKGEMALGGGWCQFEGWGPLMRIRYAVDHGPRTVAEELCGMQDGYGEPGWMPPGGWDWSGFRDSTLEAITAMDEVATRWWRATFGAEALWPWEKDEARRAV